MVIQCKTCDDGQLIRKKVRRMSGPVVALGYLILVPSLLGLVFFIGLATVMSLAGETGVGTAVAGALFFFMAGVVGSLLVTQKSALVCDRCRAMVPAH